MWDNLQLLFVWAPIINVQVILDGIFVGAVFALSAYGLALVWGVMNIKNLAQGDFVIMGGYLAFRFAPIACTASTDPADCHATDVYLRMDNLCCDDPANHRSGHVRLASCHLRPLAAPTAGYQPDLWA